jgi:hypothetical protein
VSIVVYGDDSHLEISDEYKLEFNELTLPDLMKNVGLKYTNETKNVALSPVRDLRDTNFLKRTWRFDETLNRSVAPLDLEVILHMADYSRKGLEYISGTLNTIDIQMKEFSLHGKDVFDKHSPTLLRASEDVMKYTPRIISYAANLRITSVTKDHC